MTLVDGVLVSHRPFSSPLLFFVDNVNFLIQQFRLDGKDKVTLCQSAEAVVEVTLTTASSLLTFEVSFTGRISA